MKTLLIAFIVSFGLNANAQITSPDQLPEEQRIQLIEVLNQMDPEMLTHILSEEALHWYIDQFSRETGEVTLDLEGNDSYHSRLPHDGNPYQDPNAPGYEKFMKK